MKSSSSISLPGGGGGGLAEGRAPNEAILKAIEKLGTIVGVADVVRETGLPTDEVEAEMAALLRFTNGFFEINDMVEGGDVAEVSFVASTFDVKNVRYVFPTGLRGLLKRKLVMMRVQEVAQEVGRVGFAVLRVSFGVILLLSLALILIVVIVVMLRGGGEGRRGGNLPVDAIRFVHRPRMRPYGVMDRHDFFFWVSLSNQPFRF